MSKSKISISFGALANPLHEQLAQQGFDIPMEEFRVPQDDANAITRVRIRGLITNTLLINRAERKILLMVHEIVVKHYPDVLFASRLK